MINTLSLLAKEVANRLGFLYLDTKDMHHKLEPVKFFVSRYLEDRVIDKEDIEFLISSYEDFPASNLLRTEGNFLIQSFSDLAGFAEEIELSLSNIASPSSLVRIDDYSKIITVDDIEIMFYAIEEYEHILLPYFLFLLLVGVNNIEQILNSKLEPSNINKESFKKFEQQTKQKIHLLAKLL
ncbi:hypothetical protein PGDDIFCJ_00170 [Thermus phage YS40_Isch]|nr:hypothetical protein PGDDIFCJ_00170 [Thermus phage YS40_Isch]